MKGRGFLGGLWIAAALFCLSGCLPQNGGAGPGTEHSIEDPQRPLAMGDVERPVTLKMVVKDHTPENLVDQAWIQLLNQELLQAGIGAQVEWVPIQSSSYERNLSLMLNRGSIPDFIWFQGGDLEFALQQGILTDLTDFVEHSVYLKDAMEEYQRKRLKSYPYLVYLSPDSLKVPVIREDVLQSLSTGQALLEDPTIEHYLQMMRELQSLGYPAVWTVAGSLAELDSTFQQAFGLTKSWMQQEDGTYLYQAISPQAKKKLDFYAQLYQEGLLDPDYLTDTWEDKENKFYSDQVAIVSGTQGTTLDVYQTNQGIAHGPEAILQVLPPAKGVAQGYGPLSIAKEERGIAISALSPHQDLAFQVLDFLSSPRGREVELLGLEGVHYELDQEGRYQRITIWHPPVFQTLNNLDDAQLAQPYHSDVAQSSLEMVKEYGTLDNDFVIPAHLATAWDSAQSVAAEFYADYVLGYKGEKDWEGFVQDFLSLGGQEVTDYANEMLNPSSVD